ncbi:MAG: hypothetical protein HY689_00020 [Chloroflexi bacterium]|nr:hypothetical protein [Chloroflexota bacterium]
MAGSYTVTPWEAAHAPSEAELAARIQREGKTPVLRSDPPGLRQPRQRHPYPKSWWLVYGWLRFLLHNKRDQEVVVRTGDRLELAPNVSYEVAVEGSGYATYFEVTPFALTPLPLTVHVGPWPEPGK